MPAANSPNNLTPAILCGCMGIGVGLLLGVVFGILIGRNFDGVSTSLSEAAEYQEHQKVEVIEFERRGNEIYLKFRNTGKHPVDDMYFEIEVRGEDGKLRQEYEVGYMKLVAAGETEETILKPQALEVDPVDLNGDLTVEYKYGWRTVSQE